MQSIKSISIFSHYYFMNQLQVQHEDITTNTGIKGLRKSLLEELTLD